MGSNTGKWGAAIAVVLAGMTALRGQTPPANQGRAGEPVKGIGAAVERETQGLAADGISQREEALARLQQLIGAQVAQRAEIQAVLDALAADLATQERALAVVSDSESEARIAGLLEMERGIAGWARQTMSEPAERRQKLLAWGLSPNVMPVLARVYADRVRVRVQGVGELGKIDDAENSRNPAGTTAGNSDVTASIDWTLSRLINDKAEPVRAAAMAACWGRKPSRELVAALWLRAVQGPLDREAAGQPMMEEGNDSAGNIAVNFPGGSPLQFDDSSDTPDFDDGHLACDILLHLESPLVGDRLKVLVRERDKAGKDFSSQNTPDWALTTHRLIEAYGVKEAIPILATEAFDPQPETVGGDGFFWTRRTLAIGTLAKLIGQDPETFGLRHVRNSEDERAWIWAVDAPPQVNGPPMPGVMPTVPDGEAVKAFYAWWSAHHAEYGVKEAPSKAALPREDLRGGAGGMRGGFFPGRLINPGGAMIPAPPPAAPADKVGPFDVPADGAPMNDNAPPAAGAPAGKGPEKP